MNSRFRSWIGLISVAILLLTSGTVAAQQTVERSALRAPAQCQDREDVVVDAAGSYWFFPGNAGDVITIAMNSSSFDTYLELRDGNDSILVEDDDSGPGNNALIEDYVLPYTGQYKIVARGYNGQTGPYTLSMPCMQEINCGGSVSDTVTSAAGDKWTFQGTAGCWVTIAMNSNSFDTYLELRDSNGNIVTQDDDSGPGNAALIKDFKLPYTGKYTIVARGYNGQTGAYTLSLDCRCEEQSKPINCGKTVKDTVQNAQGDRWTFSGTKDCSVTIAMKSSSFDTYLELRNASGKKLVEDDDGGQGTNSLIQNYKLPYTGKYTIVARGYNGQTGSYSLSLECTCKQPIITCGKTVNDTVDSAQGDQWTFSSTAGCLVTIAMKSSSFDTYLELHNASGKKLVENDDGGSGTNSLIQSFKLPYTGKYTIVARGYNGQTGAYTLSLQCSCGKPTIACGRTIKDRVGNAQGDQWTFSSTAGCRVTIAMDSSSFDTFLVLRNASGKKLVEDDDGGPGTNSLILNYKLPYTGNYKIVARGYNGQTGAYTLSLNCRCETGCRTTYVVKRGDTLYSIARRYGTTTQRLAEVNGLADPSVIYVGQVLCIK